MRYAGQHFLVLGLGRSGVATVRLLLRYGARVSAYDRDATRFEGLEPEVERLSGEAPPDFEPFDSVVTSPGFPARPHPKLMPEIDLAAPHLKAPLIGVTGTNGKSTTTVLIGEMLRRSGLAIPIGGNLGDPLCALVDLPADAVVAELSSFQLEHARELHVQVGVLLNLAPDHLERHGTLEAYAAAKARLAALQREDDTLIVNLDDPWARQVGEKAVARTLGFSESLKLERGAYIDGKDLVLYEDGREQLRLASDTLSPACRVPVTNTLAAMLTAHTAGATADAIRAVSERFEGLPHRARLVCTRRRVRYVNDSKATNPTAAAASLLAQPSSTHWIAGGRNKGLDFAPLAKAVRKVRTAILFGEAAPELAAALESMTPLLQVESLEEAVEAAAQRALPGDIVLLAPGCSSFDQFASFEERGRRFAELARALPEEGKC
jgi:UDP-N-acetylmuramoylalanine--D-glutamate ligase